MTAVYHCLLPVRTGQFPLSHVDVTGHSTFLTTEANLVGFFPENKILELFYGNICESYLINFFLLFTKTLLSLVANSDYGTYIFQFSAVWLVVRA